LLIFLSLEAAIVAEAEGAVEVAFGLPEQSQRGQSAAGVLSVELARTTPPAATARTAPPPIARKRRRPVRFFVVVCAGCSFRLVVIPNSLPPARLSIGAIRAGAGLVGTLADVALIVSTRLSSGRYRASLTRRLALDGPNGECAC
jgi:hypothetical protein